jgi:putative CocE/NonD family hydrolase
MARLVRAALLLVLVLLASGCLGASTTPAAHAPAYAPSASTHKVGKAIDLSIPMADGAKLHGTVFLPDGVEKSPTIVDLGPYYGNLDSRDTEGPPSVYMQHLLGRGYAIGKVSVRGTGQSEGCFMVGGAQEREDAARMVAWIANQSWSDGTVALMGISYDGTTPWEAAVTGVSQLKAIVPGEGITDLYSYSFFDGVPINNGASFQAVYVPQTDYQYDDPTQVPGWAAAQPAATQCRADQPGVISEPFKTEVDGTHGSAYWQDRDQTKLLASMRAGSFTIQGFQDYNVRMDEVQDLWAKLPEPKAFVLGQWAHEARGARASPSTTSSRSTRRSTRSSTRRCSRTRARAPRGTRAPGTSSRRTTRRAGGTSRRGRQPTRRTSRWPSARTAG